MKVELFYCPLATDTVYIPVEMEADSLLPFSGKYVNYPTNSNLYSNYPNNIETLIFPINLTETINVGDFTNLIKESLQFCETSNFFPNLKNIVILYTTSIIDETAIKSKYKIKKHFILYYLFRSFLTQELSNYKNVKDWDNSYQKCLFLIGNICKENRFPVFFEFYKNNTLSLLEYSLHYNYSLNYKDYKEYFYTKKFDWLYHYMLQEFNIDKNEFIKIYEKLEKKLNEDDFFIPKQDNWLNISAFVLPKQWKNSSIILHGETYFNSPKSKIGEKYLERFLFFTEKTWKPICTKKPFIACSDADWVNYGLKELGFKNFLEYTDYPEFIQTSKDVHHNIRNTAKITHARVVSFMKNMNQYNKEIEADVNYNYNLWSELAKKTWEEFNVDLPTLQTLSKTELINAFIHKTYTSP